MRVVRSSAELEENYLSAAREVLSNPIFIDALITAKCYCSCCLHHSSCFAVRCTFLTPVSSVTRHPPLFKWLFITRFKCLT